MLVFITILVTCTQHAKAQSVNPKTYIPKNAYSLLPTLKTETQRIFPDSGAPEYFGGLIEHESCISLAHSRCWLPTSELLTTREQGVGLGQITRAFNTDGSTRFDSLADLRNRHMAELKEISWSNVKQRPDLQMRSILLMSRDNWKRFHEVRDLRERRAFMDAAYNGGVGGTLKERLQCGLTKGCNPQYWFDNVEDICLKSKKPIYAGRSACDINRHHVRDVFEIRQRKYIPYLRLGEPAAAQ
jgi:hypothetical protein